MIQIKQTYKNRADALRFVRDWGFTFSERKFYDDCVKEGMIEPDGKSVNLCSLLAYLWGMYPPIATDSDQARMEQRAEEQAELDLEEKRLKVQKLRRSEDHVKTLESRVADFEKQQAALLLLTYDTIRHHINLASREIVHAAGAEIDRTAEIEERIEQIIDRAFNEIATSTLVTEVDIKDATNPDRDPA